MTEASAAPIRSPTVPGPASGTRAPRHRFPAGACDCHAHVFGPQHRFPYTANAAYIPPDAPPGDYVGMLTAIGCERAVLVDNPARLYGF